jgi:6-phosphofructokinase 1
VVAEGARLTGSDTGGNGKRDEFGHVRLGGIGNVLAGEIEKRTGFETRAVVLGHIQRGGSPTPFDRMLATRYGVGAIDLVHQGKFGDMVVLRGNEIRSIPIAESISKVSHVSPELIGVALSLQDRRGFKKAAMQEQGK